jgi:hypothetical protein
MVQIIGILIAYTIGSLVAAIIIAIINEDEARRDAISFIPYTEVWWSWCFVFYVAWVFITTYTGPRK